MSCADFELELSLFAAGALEDGARARVEAHLAQCAECRRELERSKAAIASAALPPLSLRDQAQLAQIAKVAAPVRRQWPLQLAAIAAALLAVVLAARTAHPRRHHLRPAAMHAQVTKAALPTELLPTVADDATVAADADPDLLDVPSSLDEDSDSALYDAVVFQETDLPYQVDTG